MDWAGIIELTAEKPLFEREELGMSQQAELLTCVGRVLGALHSKR